MQKNPFSGLTAIFYTLGNAANGINVRKDKNISHASLA